MTQCVDVFVPISALYTSLWCEIRVWARFKLNCTCSHTNTHLLIHCPAVVYFALTGFSFHFISLQFIQSFFSTFRLFCANLLNPFDLIIPVLGRSFHSTSFQFNPCAHFVSFAHTYLVNAYMSVSVCVCVIQRYRKAPTKWEKERKKTHAHIRLSYVRCVMHADTKYMYVLLWFESSKTHGTYHSFASMWIEHIERQRQRQRNRKIRTKWKRKKNRKE